MLTPETNYAKTLTKTIIRVIKNKLNLMKEHSFLYQDIPF